MNNETLNFDISGIKKVPDPIYVINGDIVNMPYFLDNNFFKEFNKAISNKIKEIDLYNKPTEVLMFEGMDKKNQKEPENIITLNVNPDLNLVGNDSKRLIWAFNNAKNKNIIIKTVINGQACTYATEIAIQGTKGFRTIHEDSHIIISYKNYDLKSMQKKHISNKTKLYQDCSKMGIDEINKILSRNVNCINAERAIELGLFDTIIKQSR